MKCDRKACKSENAVCTHTQTGLVYCVPCARKINAFNEGLVTIPTLLAECQRDRTVFVPIVVDYKTKTPLFDSAGDRFIECPTCARRYFYNGETDYTGEPREHIGEWYADRPLKLVGDRSRLERPTKSDDSSPRG